ncbi:MAG: hypothetical protein LKE52_02980 [Bacilli bacterium]|jgi:hypothetical protein|nr:hypothetical protein [Bacilli bacterium]
MHFMKRVASLSRKEAFAYLILLTSFFLIDLSLLTIGLIHLNPETPDTNPSYALPMAIAGGSLLFCCLLVIALSAISSNYIRKHSIPVTTYDLRKKKDKE